MDRLIDFKGGVQHEGYTPSVKLREFSPMHDRDRA
jgi:hypothetical protein